MQGSYPGAEILAKAPSLQDHEHIRLGEKVKTIYDYRATEELREFCGW